MKATEEIGTNIARGSTPDGYTLPLHSVAFLASRKETTVYLKREQAKWRQLI